MEHTDMEWIEVTNVTNDIEYEIIKGLLDSAGIPAVKRYRGDIGAFLEVVAGTPFAGGIGILVPPDRYEEASRLVNTDFNNDSVQE
jgi:hypothetical protein